MGPKPSASSSKYPAIMSGPNKTGSDAKAAANKQHRRSRTGCFTCRLRRKKCEEGKPACKACRNLNLKCEYSRPMWWSNNEKRKQQKDLIKEMIRQTKLNEKATQVPPMSANTPPSLCHSVPTTDTYSDTFAHTRAASEESQLSPDFNFSHYPPQDYLNSSAMGPPDWSPPPGQHPVFSPYEVDIKTETQTFVNDVPTRRDSSISTFSTYHAPSVQPAFGPLQPESWVQRDYFESRRESIAEEPLDFTVFELPHAPFTPSHQAMIQVDECDRPLLNHFIDNVLRLIFPILEVNQHGSARTDIVMPALETNKTYLHCCLSIAALHLKATERIQGEQINNDILRHRYATISELCTALDDDTNHVQILEATLAMIFFSCSVGRPDDGLPDIPWHQHFLAATSLVQKLELPRYLADLGSVPHGQPPFNMTLTAWIDILGATMLGRAPAFADTYREKHMACAPIGLAELMGCDDKVMFLLSEVACLEALALEGMDHVTLCTHIGYLGEEITRSEQNTGPATNVYSSTATIQPKQLKQNITAVYRLASRIYLCSLVPDFDRHQATATNLVEALCASMEYIPGGAEGCDRSLVWPLLIAGSVSTENSSFRTMFPERCQRLGEASDFGSLGRVKEILKDVWKTNDDAAIHGEKKSIHWRDAMRQRGWDFLLI